MLTATADGITIRTTEPLRAGFYYTSPDYGDLDRLPGLDASVDYGDAVRRMKIIPVADIDWEAHEEGHGARHAVAVIPCPHVTGDQLSCPEGCTGTELRHYGHW